MTQMQIAYQQHLENQRHNQTVEGETQRHNKVTEGQTDRDLTRRDYDTYVLDTAYKGAKTAEALSNAASNATRLRKIMKKQKKDQDKNDKNKKSGGKLNTGSSGKLLETDKIAPDSSLQTVAPIAGAAGLGALGAASAATLPLLV